MKNILLYKFLILILSFCLWIPAASAQESNTEKPVNGSSAAGRLMIKIPLSGELAFLGKEAKRGAELALKIFGAGLNVSIIDENDPNAQEPLLKEVALVLGYLGEANFSRDAPKYIFLKQPAILPFFMTAEAFNLEGGNFFKMMPNMADQGRFMALEILKNKKRPKNILIITSPLPTPSQSIFVDEFISALNTPPSTNLPGKNSPPLKPVDKSTQIIKINKSNLLNNNEAIKELGNKKPDVIILSLNYHEAINLAPYLASSAYSKSPIWGPSSIALRDVGAAFTALNLKLNLSLPIDLDDSANKDIVEFTKKYKELWNVQPSWVAALAYDATVISIKAVSSSGSSEKIVSFLTGQKHYSLNSYTLNPMEPGQTPIKFMEVKADNLSNLP